MPETNRLRRKGGLGTKQGLPKIIINPNSLQRFPGRFLTMFTLRTFDEETDKNKSVIFPFKDVHAQVFPRSDFFPNFCCS